MTDWKRKKSLIRTRTWSGICANKIYFIESDKH